MNRFAFLDGLIGMSICHAIKSKDLDLYDFGFMPCVDCSDLISPFHNSKMYILHTVCRFNVIWKAGDNHIKAYFEDTDYKEFAFDAKNFIGLTVKNVFLNEKHDLWLDFGICKMEFATHENNEESWRLFIKDGEGPHFVVSNKWIDFS